MLFKWWRGAVVFVVEEDLLFEWWRSKFCLEWWRRCNYLKCWRRCCCLVVMEEVPLLDRESFNVGKIGKISVKVSHGIIDTL